ncbi:unnamed protein product [Fusarium graminearum]|nr:unnamed protein product [Fusarium graminearum]
MSETRIVDVSHTVLGSESAATRLEHTGEQNNKSATPLQCPWLIIGAISSGPHSGRQIHYPTPGSPANPGEPFHSQHRRTGKPIKFSISSGSTLRLWF